MSQLTTSELRYLCQTAKEAASAAGQYIQSKFDGHYTQRHKAGGDTIASQVVTEVDLNAQQIILDQLQNSITTYDLGLLTEESADDESRGIKDYFWCIDPLDGTLPFTERRTGYAVSIALISNAGDPVIGVVYIPDLQICYSSIVGEGVLCNDQPFECPGIDDDKALHFYMDRSFKTASYYEVIETRMKQWAYEHQITNTTYHTKFGGVRNAIGTMTSGKACYFKFPKKPKGGGSIWDYAATSLFFTELGLKVSNSKGKRLYLNDLQTTFMNDQGVIYATDEGLSRYIILLGKEIEGLP